MTAMLTVRDVMSETVTTVTPETPLKDVARLLIRLGVAGFPVVEGERVVGVVSEADLLVKEQGEAALPHRRGARILGESKAATTGRAKLRATTAGGAMTTPAITIGPDATVADAAAVMVDRGVNRLPVVVDGALVGIVTRADLVRAYVRTDRQIEASIRDDLLHRHLLVDPHRFDVRVEDGVVRISGEAETRSLAELIERLIASVPGVIAVDANLSWAVDDQVRRAPSRDHVFPVIR